MGNDLRDVAPEDYWRRFNAMLGTDGLLTYRYLGRRTAMLHGQPHDSMRIRSDMRTASGGIMASVLAICSAEAGGFSDVNTVPAPVTAALSILDDGRDVAEIAIRRTFVQTGRTMGFSQAEIVDAANPDRVIAIAESTGVKLANAPAGFKPLDLEPEIADRPDLPPLHRVFGATRTDGGVWMLPEMTAEASSTSGSLHLGPIHIVLDMAASELAARESAAAQIEDWKVTFVARGTKGPFVVEGAAARGNLGRLGCRLILRDRGRDNRIIATAVATFRLG